MAQWHGLDVTDRTVLVATTNSGGALGVLAALLNAGARVRLLAPDPTPAVLDLADRERLEVVRATFDPTLLDGVALVITAEHDTVGDAVLSAARDRGVIAHRLPAPGDGRPSHDRPRRERGEVILIGGGPGDPGLLTVEGLEMIKDADVIATDRLAPLAALDQARPGTEIIDVGKVPRGPGAEQQTIESLLIERARAGQKVVRLKGGDSFVFGRGGEEWQSCAAAGVAVRVVPGVTSATAAPAAATIPVTHRQLSQGFCAVTGHVPPGDPRSTVDWSALARSGCTLVIMMGMANLAAIAETLINSGLPAETPAAVIEDGTLPSMRTLRAPLVEIAGRAAEQGLGAPATVVIGAVAGFDPGAAG